MKTPFFNRRIGRVDIFAKRGFGLPTELTIAGGEVSVTGWNPFRFHTIDTEGDAASDDLDTINGGNAGDLMMVRAADAARTVVCKDGAGFYMGGADVSLDDADKTLLLVCSAANTWHNIPGYIASAYAPIAKGVTNGDSHDHVDGDGAQINHLGLSNIGTNAHSVIDTHLASTANPHSVTKAQVSLSNVTNEAQIAKSIGTAPGDIIYFTASATPARLAKGSDAQVLTLAAGLPSWAAAAAGGVDTSGTPVANDIARFIDADTVEGRSYSEFISDLGGLARIEIGSYTGDGSTSHVVSMTASWTPKYGFVFTLNVVDGQYVRDHARVDNQPANISWQAYSGLAQDDRLLSFAAGSFTVSDASANSYPNKSGEVYGYVMIG